MSDFNKQVVDEFRTNGGKVGGYFEGAPLLLLTTKGAKSNQPRVAPVMYLADGDRLLIFASKAGAPTNPDWYHNLLAHPEANIEVGNESYNVTSSVVTGEERDRLYAKQAKLYPGFADYETKTTRKIPVVALKRI
jgi:deazaflavin-dependent oxidoreductase (nitroreductase family)